MRIVHVLRKPLESTVANNISKHGCGALNIDRCRISTGDNLNGGRYAEHGVGEADGPTYGHGINKRRPGEYQQPSGRWPANLILQHLPGCERKGTRRVKGHKGYPNGPGGKSDPRHGWGGKRSEDVRPNAWAGHADEDGTETVPNWHCAVGCPVRALDEQSGTTTSTGGNHSGHNAFGQDSGWNPHQNRPTTIHRVGDTGGASRFFQQQGSKESLATYLADLIAPDHLADCIVLGVFGDALDLAAMDPESAHGAVVDMDGPPVQLLTRVLKPGAHILLIAPEGDPTGHAGAIAFEDAGFEVRDAILVLDSPKDTAHYVPKPSRREREAGCFALPGVEADVSVERDPESAGAGNPRAGAGRGAGSPRYRCALCDQHLGALGRGPRADRSPGVLATACVESEDGKHQPFEYARGPKIRNLHPTVKPIAVMVKLLDGVPTDAPIIDPFMGSGTTMVACLRTGHDGIGIERDPNYIPIADARVRHWDRAEAGWSSVEIESDAEPEVLEAPEVSLSDFLGL